MRRIPLFALMLAFFLPISVLADEKPQNKEKILNNIRQLHPRFLDEKSSLIEAITRFSLPRIGIGIEVSESGDNEIFVERVYKNSPAAGKLEVNDVIIAIDGADSPAEEEVDAKIWTKTAGIKVRLIVCRSATEAKALILETVLLRGDKTTEGKKLIEKVEQEGAPLLAAAKSKLDALAAALDSEQLQIENLDKSPLLREAVAAVGAYKEWIAARFQEATQLLEIK